MINIKNLNKVSAWFVFAVCFIVYSSTAARTINFWDSGELVACASNLQIGHSTAAPLYLLLGRFFSLFAFKASNIAFAINILSVAVAAFTIYFLCCSIQILIERIVSQYSKKNEKKSAFISTAASIIGAFSFAFCSTFWSTANQANIYVVSCFFTSICFWSSLKFFEAKTKKTAYRWLILCSLLLGFALCTDTLTAFIVPVLVFIVYFKNRKLGYWEIIKVSVFAVIFFIIAWFSISFITLIASKFELLFVNDFNLPYNSGLYAFSICFIGIIIFSIYFSQKKSKIIPNLVFVCIAAFVSSTSIYCTIIIRSSSNPPIDQNNPETIFNFRAYLKQKQYSQNSLWHGHQYNSVLDKKNPYTSGEAIYDTVNNKYEIITHKPKSNYKNSDKRFIPRMWSNQPEHIAAYREWTEYKGDKPPNFATNIKFMFNYQFSHLYFRYFMWNFVGKQNDALSHGGALNGNWISGIDFIDNIRLGAINKSPNATKGRATYYFLPLLLGIFGIISQYKKDKKIFIITSLLFVCTGIFVAFYLNLHPYQIRERDYLFMSSFFAFCIWIGYGILWIYETLTKYFSHKQLFLAIFIVAFLAVPTQLLAKNYKTNNLNSNDLAHTSAYNLLNSCEKNAILFTHGDNETFPLWYLQEVEQIRTDISIINLSFLNTDWYIDQIRRKKANSEGIFINVTKNLYIAGQREFLLIRDATSAFVEDIYFENTKEILEDYTYIFNKFLDFLLKNNFDKKRPDEFQNFKTFYSQIQPLNSNPSFIDFSTIISNLTEDEYRNEFGLSKTQADEIISDFYRFLIKQKNYHIPLNAVLNFVFSNNKETKIETKLYDYPIDYFPTRNLMLRINRNQILDKINLSADYQKHIVQRMEWTLNKESLTKSELISLEIILANMWERPIYFCSTMNDRYFLGLDKYLYLEGFAYRLLPIETETAEIEKININTDVMYKNITQNFKWKNFNRKNLYYDENDRTTLTNIRNHLSLLAESLYYEGKLDESEKVLDISTEKIPNGTVAYSAYSIEIVRGYYRLSKKTKAAAIAKIMLKNAINELDFYNKLPTHQQQPINIYKQRALTVIEELYNMANYFIDKDFIFEMTNELKNKDYIIYKSNN
ncbi:DUF2723 domain-containing protein [Bacteroidales bacterium OttesenSCG-928-I21]|nr:DUF2723 domain-containing protein [Bacteroidales bacterium OttesenSCG-928-I21]